MKNIAVILLSIIAFCASQAVAQNEAALAEGETFKYTSNKTTHQMPDSVMVFGTIKGKSTETLVVEKNVYTRDKFGNQVKELRYHLDRKHKLVPHRSISTQFDLDGRKTEKLFGKWDSLSNRFVENRKIIYNYPVNDICIESTYALRKNAWEIKDSIKTVTTYNGNQDPIEIIQLEFQNDKWTNTVKIAHRYDGDFRILDKNIYHWINDNWEIFSKQTYSYDIDPKRAGVRKMDMSKTYPVEINFELSPNGTPMSIKEVMDFTMVTKTSIPTIETVVNEKPKHTLDNKPIKENKNQGFYVNAGDDEATVSIFNLAGELLLKKEITGTSFVKMNTLGKGTFLVKITIDDNTVTRKLVLK